ncbi:MAG: AAA family ATPase [Nitrospinaceae bacterium]|jgi:general secretion pathway protein A|nr:AAA family ATPase [Nitrospinaceae bacterium]
MYQNFYRFKEKPFSLTPDPKFLYLSKQYQGALDHMLYGIKQREGFMVIAGDVGTGKTTLCRCLLDRLDKNVEVALILNPMLSDMDLLRNIVQDLRIKPLHATQAVGMIEDNTTGEEITIEFEPSSSSHNDLMHVDLTWINSASKKELIDTLNMFLLDQHEQEKSTVLIIDEAQNLSLDVMEQLRILSNLETEKEKLLQIIFVGQLELNEKLKLPTLKQLNQRISIRYEISPLTQEEANNYIAHRVLVAGAASQVSFTKSALKEIFKYSNGYPRLINLVCDRALLAGYNAQVDKVDRQHVQEAIRSLLGKENKGYFFKRFLKTQLPVIASLLFFLAGLAFFTLSRFEPEEINIAFSSAKVFQQTSPIHTPPAKARVETRKESMVAEPAPKAEEVKPVIIPTPALEQTSPNLIEPIATQENIGGNQQSATASITPANKLQKAPNNASPATAEKLKGNYRIQVYSLRTQAEADERIAKLTSAGFDTFWKKAVSAGQDWYIVYVGPFKDLNSAKINFKALKFSGRKPILLSVSTTG